MPQNPKTKLRGAKRNWSKSSAPARGKPARPRTNGGRLVYAGADFDEQKVLRAMWEGAAK